MAFTSTRALQAASGLGGYTIDQSLRFNDNDSAYLSRTPASAGNRKTWTWSGWVKKTSLGSTYGLLEGNLNFDGSNRFTKFGFAGGDVLSVQDIDTITSPAYNLVWATSALFRDASAWYHLVCSYDSTQASSSDAVKIYVNGIEQAVTFTAYTGSYVQNRDSYVNATNIQSIGTSDAANYFDGYMAEVHFIDGQALDPSYFGETDEDYGHWKPIAYTGSYGTNGFYLDFSNSGSIGEDQAGSNDWTANNLAATDVVLDSPTNNFCTWNPLSKNSNQVLAEGNLLRDSGSTWTSTLSTFAIPSSGKWYAEFVSGDVSLSFPGLQSVSALTTTTAQNVDFTIVQTGGYRYNGTTEAETGSISTGDVIGIAVDADTGVIKCYINNSLDHTFTQTLVSGTDYFFSAIGSADMWANFGQDSSFAGNKTAQNNTDANGVGDFYYAPPSGFLALCTANLSDPAVIPGDNFNTVLWTGDGSNPRTISGVGFQADLIWHKSRSSASMDNPAMQDIVRGFNANNNLYTSLTGSETAYPNRGVINSVSSTGFTVNQNASDYSTADGLNENGVSFVAWNWKANNTSGSTNTDGSITSTVAANPDAGFSIVSYTGNASAGATVGHGLSQAPDMIILKDRSGATNWSVYHASNTSAPETDALALNTTDATSDYLWWNDTAPTSSVFSLGAISNTNASGNNFIAYCFHSVDGFSKFGSYTGNGSTDGPFVYTGFRPAWVMVKRTDVANSWWIIDTKRDIYNGAYRYVYANLSNGENTNTSLQRGDVLSNGFKLKQGGSGWLDQNASGGTYIFAAFAEYPFKFTNAR